MNPMANIPQMLMQSLMGGAMNPMQNPMVQKIMQMKNQGMTPEQALNQLSQEYPAFQNAMPFLQGKNPQEMAQTAQNFLQGAGVNPNDMMGQLKRYM